MGSRQRNAATRSSGAQHRDDRSNLSNAVVENCEEIPVCMRLVVDQARAGSGRRISSVLECALDHYRPVRGPSPARTPPITTRWIARSIASGVAADLGGVRHAVAEMDHPVAEAPFAEQVEVRPR